MCAYEHLRKGFLISSSCDDRDSYDLCGGKFCLWCLITYGHVVSVDVSLP